MLGLQAGSTCILSAASIQSGEAERTRKRGYGRNGRGGRAGKVAGREGGTGVSSAHSESSGAVSADFLPGLRVALARCCAVRVPVQVPEASRRRHDVLAACGQRPPPPSNPTRPVRRAPRTGPARGHGAPGAPRLAGLRAGRHTEGSRRLAPARRPAKAGSARSGARRTRWGGAGI